MSKDHAEPARKDQVTVVECEPTDRYVDQEQIRGTGKGHTFGQIAKHWGDKVADKELGE